MCLTGVTLSPSRALPSTQSHVSRYRLLVGSQSCLWLLSRMPASTQYEVLLDFTNDTHDCASVQLLRSYGRNTSSIVLLHPGESVSLVLDAGSVYQYALKTRSKVANVTARTWRDVTCTVSQLFPNGSHTMSNASSEPWRPVNGITVDRLWRDVRFCMWNDP